jgi:hypothetical protein
MRKYYLFIIKKEFAQVYRNNADILYKTIENLYYIKEENFNYGISLYNQLCLTFNVGILTNYFQHHSLAKKNKYKYLFKNKKEITLIEINHSCCTVITNLNFPTILKIFDYYSKDIFVCDFENKDYFWLSKQYNKKRIYEYN